MVTMASTSPKSKFSGLIRYKSNERPEWLTFESKSFSKVCRFWPKWHTFEKIADPQEKAIFQKLAIQREHEKDTQILESVLF